jgi:hypothetical protein
VSIDVTTRHEKIVNSMPEAWVYIMKALETIGPDPIVSINPCWEGDMSDTQNLPARKFMVVVAGSVTIEEDEEDDQ